MVKKQKQNLIKAEDSVEELVEKYPEIISFLMDRGIVCILCGEPYWGQLGDLIENKNKDAKQVIDDLNSYLNK